MMEFFGKKTVQEGIVHGVLAGLAVGLYLIPHPPSFLNWIVDILALGIALVCGLIVISQFVLPVQTMRERRRVFSHLVEYASGSTGPILFVKNGELIGRKEELQRFGRGVALLDANSAMVLERAAATSAWLALRRGTGAVPPGAYPLVRAVGPGIAFIDPGERIVATLDLRRQSRSGPAQGHTREGLEINAFISVSFGLIPPPEPEKKAPPAQGTASPPREPNTAERVERQLPAHPFNPNSAFKAVYGMALNKEQQVESWTDLPLRVAQEHFRNTLAEYTLDELFQPTKPNIYPYAEFQAKVGSRVKKDPTLSERGLIIYSAVVATIKMPREVQNQRIRSWQARWQKAKLQHEAASTAQAVRAEGRRRSEAQAAIFADFQQKLRSVNDPGLQHALAMTLMRALQRAASDPTTRQMLPTETLQVLDNSADWIK